MKYYATKKGSFRIHNRKDFETELNALPDGRYTIEVKKYRKNKSQEQLGYLFEVVYRKFLEGAVEQGWELANVDQVDAWCKEMYAKTELINRHTGQIVEIPELKRDMNTLEMMTYIDKIIAHCQEYFGVEVPAPLKQSKINFDE